ncbi:ATP-binding protein [Polaromonas sp. CG_9.11]|uniref:sensor histidine kinase n=1 Tax=Polaromonas sp. CG_9.11 TaxID=2787730 RepID=UPI0018CA98E9|nr:ATP-binding protein [Polaromonas sp. CG_9.11]MBG6075678.1 signal transduction histidine kinase [Polaromonas sp. CG_9.11]
MPALPVEFPVNGAGVNQNFASWWHLVRAMGIARLAWAACGLSIVVLASVALLVHQADRKGVNNALDTSVSLDAKGYAKFVSLNLAIIDRQLTALREQHLQGLRLPAQTVMNSRLKELNGLVLQVAVANAGGLVVDSSLGMPNPPVSIADRVHFRVFKNNPEDRLFISEPVLGRVSKRQSLQLVRPMLATDGKFLGVIVASIDPELLKTYFTDMKALDNQGRLSIVGLDGIVRFRLTNLGFSAGQNDQASPHWKQASTLPAGIYDESSLVDGIYRRIGFHRVEGYPLLVAVGTGLHEQLRNFEVRWNLIWSLALALAAVLTMVAATIARLAKEQKRSFGLLEQNRLRTLESTQTKSSFLASVSHELRTPLNSILGFSELIRDTGNEPRISQYAGLIHKSGTHLHALVNTILDLTKIESGNMGLTLEHVDMPQLLETLVAIHKVNADEKNVELSLSLDGVVLGTVLSDRAKLVQVMNNVIHNAIKFTPTGTIFVVIKPAGDSGLLISVIDTGIGIPADKTAQVFERFNTIDAPVRGSGARGSGLGLALCGELLHLMHGKITLSSEVGHGTTVELFIPHHFPAERKPA